MRLPRLLLWAVGSALLSALVFLPVSLVYFLSYMIDRYFFVLTRKFVATVYTYKASETYINTQIHLTLQHNHKNKYSIQHIYTPLSHTYNSSHMVVTGLLCWESHLCYTACSVCNGWGLRGWGSGNQMILEAWCVMHMSLFCLCCNTISPNITMVTTYYWFN